ncbi:MAG TPA: phosphotransferase [Thermoleophilaceae bacterium]|nr:phosphotransferase [Thermoleophilaceae bacterium]
MNDLTEIVARLAALLGPREGEVEPLGGGLVNRKFKVRFGGVDYVLRLPRRDAAELGIDRQAGFTANTAAAELGFAPAVTTMLEEPPCLVTIYVAGEQLEPDQLREARALAQVARILRQFHGSGVSLPVSFDCLRVVEDDAAAATSLPHGYGEALDRAREACAAVEDHPEHRPVPCANDLVASSFIRADGKLWVVDWEYAAEGDPYFDLGNFAVSNGLDERAEELLLEEYHDEPPGPRRLAALRLMRFMSDLREALWGLRQNAGPDSDVDFDEYARRHFERLERTASDPRFGEWIQQARGS